jgi:molybdopterin-dependent oxidoreductase alpha subunit
MKTPRHGGGWHSIGYSWKKSREAGSARKLWSAMRTRNACKTCALGMGGQKGGMVNETGNFPEVCKKGFQAMTADMQPPIASRFWYDHPVDILRSWSSRKLESAGRLSEPVLYTRSSGTYTPIGWDEALGRIASKLKEIIPEESFWYFSGRSSNEAGFLLQLLARLYGTNNINNCSYYCHQASGVGLSSVIGSGTATITLEDLDKTDLVFVIGANPASNHPRLMRSLMKVRRRGGDVIVINPIREIGLEKFKIPSDARSLLLGSRIASDYLQPHIGGDLALLSGMAKRTFELNGEDGPFLGAHCTNVTELRSHLEDLEWPAIIEASGVSFDEIDRVVRKYIASRSVVFSWAMGITHHTRGTESVQSIANLALIRGMVGREGCGLMPLRGHSNVQGVGSMGVTPRLKDAIFKNLTTHFGLTLPRSPGLDTLACMEAAATGALKFGFCLGGNLFGSNPDSSFASKALSNLDQLVYLNTTLNTGHTRGLAKETIILPVRARDEEDQPTTQESMFSYVRLSDGGPARIPGPRSEVDIIADLATRVLGEEVSGDSGRLPTWRELRSTSAIRSMIALSVPGYEAIGEIDETHIEFQIGGRTFHVPRFSTTDGRAILHVHPLSPAEDPGGLRLMTIRSEGQFNTVVYEEEDAFRGIDSRDVVLMNPDDISERGLTPGDSCRVLGPGGTMDAIRVVAFERIRPGSSAMYFPEANVLLDRRIDPLSRTPAFRSARIEVEPTPR